MITIQLDPAREDRLRRIAESQGEDTAQLAQRLLEDFVDATAWPKDSADDWADASVALAAEILPKDDWDEENTADGPR